MSIIDQVESPSRARPTRATAVLDIATQASGWGKPLPEGWGRGVAVLRTNQNVCCLSVFGGKADINWRCRTIAVL
jgi:hypothetical protein